VQSNMSAATDELNETRLTDYKDAFALFDKDKDGRISKLELKEMFKALGQTPSDQDISDMVREVDSTKQGNIGLADFIGMMTRRRKELAIEEDDDIQQAFKAFDLNKDGFIDGSELKTVLERLGEKLTESEVADIIKDADKDNDGKLNFNEFLSMMSRPRAA